MRLIDADELGRFSFHIMCEGEDGEPCERCVVDWDDIETAPTVDAVEVVHGRWIFEYWKSGYIKRCNCSECGNNPKDAYSPPNYCDNCGAKMDRKDDEKCG